MIDYTKIYLLNIDVQKLLKSRHLDFKSTISKTTGEINENVFIAKYHFCEITVKIIKEEKKPERTHIIFSGSIHKMWNDLKGIKSPNYDEKNFYRGYNGNQFTLNDIINVRQHLEKLFDCKASDMFFMNIEFGVNTVLGFNPHSYIKGLLYHRNILFEARFKGNFSKAIHDYFNFKIYNKTYQYGMIENVLRVELQINKMEELKRKGVSIEIETFQDINAKTLNKVAELLIKRFDEVMHYDYSIDKKKLTKRELEAIKDYSNPRYWIEDLKSIHRDRPKKKLQKITLLFSKQLHKQIKKEIQEKCVTINQDSEPSKCVIINHSSIEVNITQSRTKNNIKKEIKNHEVEKPPLSYKNQITKYNPIMALNYNSR